MNDYNIKKLYEDMEMELISSMKRNYKRHLKEEDKTGFKYSQWQAEKLKELKRYQRENKNIISGYTKVLPKEISKHLNNELKEGSIKAINQYNKVMGKSLKPNKIMNHSFFRTNGRKVNALIKVVNNDLKTANTAVLRMANDQYRQVIHKSAFFVANGVFTEKQAANMATKELTELQKTKLAIDEANKDFLNRGFNCIEYKDGRRVNIASYSQMAVRTASLRAQLMGEGDFRKSIGRVLVKSTSHGGACPICQKWENKIFIDDVYSGGTKKDGKYMLLSDAMKQGFLHPNCRHGLTTYYPELEDMEDYTDEEYEDDVNWINNRINELTSEELNYINRNIKRFDRLENGLLAPSNTSNSKNKKAKWEIAKKKIVDYIYEIKTNERTPLKLYQLPNKHYTQIKNVINNAPTTMKKVLNDNIDKFKFKNIKTRRTARYNSKFDYIKINLEKDAVNPRGSYKTLFHEMSHNIDNFFGNISNDKVFEQLLINDFNDVLKKYKRCYNVTDDQAYKEISKAMKQSPKMGSISDLVGGITKNKCVGKYKHPDNYWKHEGKLTAEAFAHFGSASIRKDMEELSYINDMFPNAYDYFKMIVKRRI
jgi:hypothetical protein